MRIFGIGTDIVEIARIERIWQRYGQRFAKHILGEAELVELARHRQPARLLAKRFAAKEAVAKALGTGFSNSVYLPQICIVKDTLGKPNVVFTHATKKYVETLGHITSHISISDEIHYAIAFAMLQQE